jgi:hypothetical protein
MSSIDIELTQRDRMCPKCGHVIPDNTQLPKGDRGKMGLLACRHCAANEAVPGAKKVKYNPHNEGQVEIEAPMTRVE